MTTLTEKLEYINQFNFIPLEHTKKEFIRRAIIFLSFFSILIAFQSFDMKYTDTGFIFYIIPLVFLYIINVMIFTIMFGNPLLLLDLTKFNFSYFKKASKRNKYVNSIDDLREKLKIFNNLKKRNIIINDETIYKEKNSIRKILKIKKEIIL